MPRILLGEVALIASLLIVLAAVHFPWQIKETAIGWQNRPSQSNGKIDPTEVTWRNRTIPSVQLLGSSRRAQVDRAAPPKVVPVYTADDDNSALPSPRPMVARDRVVNNPDIRPKFVGGLAAYYIDIQYPPEAIEAGIEGRLVLQFVVAADGSVHDIEIMRPLHPLCDSAAVVALRRSHFIPGIQNGKTVSVRMSLPVRFMLVDNESNLPKQLEQ